MDTAEIVEEVLAHHGMKGMKWGIQKRRENIAVSRAGEAARKAELTKGGRSQFRVGHRPRDYGDVRRSNQAARAARKETRAGFKADKIDRKIEKRFAKPRDREQLKADIHNHSIDASRARISQINSKPEYVKATEKGTLKNPDHPTTKKYLNEVKNAYVQELQHTASQLKSPSGKITFEVVPSTKDFQGFGPNVFDVRMIKSNLAHANSNSDTFRVELVKDENGLVIDFKLVNDSLAQGMDFTNDFLAHHGTKGMKWGVRNRASQAKASFRRRTGRSGPQPVTVQDKPTSKKIKTKGGEGQPAHPDAVTPRISGQVARKSGVKALSDNELRAYTNRLNLEQQAKRLQYEDSSLGRKAVLTVLRDTGKATNKELNKEVMKQGRRAVTAAIAAV